MPFFISIECFIRLLYVHFLAAGRTAIVVMARKGTHICQYGKILRRQIFSRRRRNAFGEALKQCDKQSIVQQFAANLLKAKYLLDNYVVHHAIYDVETQESNPWLLRKMVYDGKNKKWSVNNLASEKNTQDELVQLLSMFEVTYTAKQRKNYLVYCLLHLFDNRDPKKYLEFLQGLADKYFYDVYMIQGQPNPDAFDKAVIPNGKLCVQVNSTEPNFTDTYKRGSAGVPLFVFNYTDYILWKRYADEMRGDGQREKSDKRKNFFDSLGCSDFGLEPFDKFYFTRTRRSLEHFFPQANVVDGQRRVRMISTALATSP